MPITKSVDLEELARSTHGFVGADLESLAKEAAMNVLRRNIQDFNLEEGKEIPQEVLEKLKITGEDFREAIKVVRPSAMREVLIETPNTKWKDIGGLENIKAELKETVEWPLKHASSFERLGIKPPKGILIYGPPGTGKTLLARAVANESEANFISIKGPELISMWAGESEKGIRKIFEKARQASPTVIFFDEIDSIAGRRGSESGSKVTERMVNQLLSEMDGLEEMNDVVVIAATNRPDILDPALLRPGRFDRIVMAQIPDELARESIFKVHTSPMPLSKDVDIKKLAEETKGYTGSDIESVCREAGMLTLREDLSAKEITMKKFDEALKKVNPSITERDIKTYEEIESNYLRTARGAAIRDAQQYMG